MTGFVPARLAIFKLAFSHKSNQGIRDSSQTNNERLEYLGDAVLGTIVAEYLFKKYPDADEGFLTKMRSKIVKRKSLNHIGDAMGLDVLLTEYNRTRLSASMLGNAVEALVGAVYLEKGYRPTKRFVIQRMLKLYVDMHELETVDDNYKSQLLEHCQKNGKQITYKLVKKFKHDRRDRFKVAVMIGSKEIATADDFNKKAAEQSASLRALQKLGVVDKETAQALKQKAEKPSYERKNKTKRKRDHKSSSASSQEVEQSPRGDKPAKRKRRAKIVEDTPAPSTQPPAPNSQATKPPRKQRRNTSRLGRAIWHGTATANAALYALDPDTPPPPQPKPSPQSRSRSSAQRKTSRRRAVPLRTLVPMLASVGAALDAVAAVAHHSAPPDPGPTSAQLSTHQA